MAKAYKSKISLMLKEKVRQSYNDAGKAAEIKRLEAEMQTLSQDASTMKRKITSQTKDLMK